MDTKKWKRICFKQTIRLPDADNQSSVEINGVRKMRAEIDGPFVRLYRDDFKPQTGAGKDHDQPRCIVVPLSNVSWIEESIDAVTETKPLKKA